MIVTEKNGEYYCYGKVMFKKNTIRKRKTQKRTILS